MKKTLLGILVLSAVSLGTGSALASSTVASAQTNSMGHSQFPKIVQMAMDRFPTDVLSWAYAPTLYPLPVVGGNVLFYKTAVYRGVAMSFPGRQVSYNVSFRDLQGHLVAQFDGSQFDTARHANQGFLSGFGDVFAVNGLKSPTLLDTGLHGTAVEDDAKNASHVLWSEGRWKIDVSGTKTTEPPIAAANEVVKFLHKHFLPVPDPLGEISVTVDGRHTSVALMWQKGNQLFEVDTTAASKQPIETALAMAISMNKYSRGDVRPSTTTVSYQEEGMTERKAANLFTSKLGYSMYVFPEYQHATSGSYDVFTMKGDANAWFSVGRLSSKDNFAKLAIPIMSQLSQLGQVSEANTNGTLTLMAVSLKKHVSEEYVFTTINGKAFRFHIVHESDWESNNPFFAMFSTIR